MSDPKLIAAALKRLDTLKKQECLDPANPDSRPTTAQQEVISDFGKIKIQHIVAGTQSGKSQVCSRLTSWFLMENHPSWTRPIEWGNEPLLILVAGRTGKQIEESLLPKIESYLEPNTYKVVRIGNIVQRLEHQNGNRIVFQSLENPNVARERIQSYVAHLVWLDEMPPTMGVIDELLRRIQARSGHFLASFTPLIRNEDIRKIVDGAKLPYAKKYQFKMFDNPLYAKPEKQAEILASMGGLPQHIINTRLYGDWTVDDDAVYYFDYDKMVEMPQNYSPLSWRHVASVDPALSSALGLTIWAEKPSTNIWYCVHSEYVRGILVPTELVTAVESKLKMYNIVRRISDPHEVWYIQQASSMGYRYYGVHKKNDRKAELIKQLQERLGSGEVRISPTCEDLIHELQECRWADKSGGRIINASSYHLLDSSQYFCDLAPKPEHKIVSTGWQDHLYQQNEKRKVTEEKMIEKARKAGKSIKIKQARGWSIF